MGVSDATREAQRAGLERISPVLKRVQLRIDELAGVQTLNCLQKGSVELWDHASRTADRAVVAAMCVRVSRGDCERCTRFLKNL